MLVGELNVNGVIKQLHTERKYKAKLVNPEAIPSNTNGFKLKGFMDEHIETLEWVTGELKTGIAGTIFHRDDDMIFPASLIADIEPVIQTKSISEDIDYSKEIAWIYQDENFNDIPIYLHDKIKMKVENGGTIIGKVQFAEDLKKYYLQGVTCRYFFFIGCEVEKIQEENTNEN